MVTTLRPSRVPNMASSSSKLPGCLRRSFWILQEYSIPFRPSVWQSCCRQNCQKGTGANDDPEKKLSRSNGEFVDAFHRDEHA